MGTIKLINKRSQQTVRYSDTSIAARINRRKSVILNVIDVALAIWGVGACLGAVDVVVVDGVAAEGAVGAALGAAVGAFKVVGVEDGGILAEGAAVGGRGVVSIQICCLPSALHVKLDGKEAS